MNSIDKFFEIDKEDIRQSFDFQVERLRFKENMDFLNEMSVEEHTLYKKWQELNLNRVKMMRKKSSMGRYYDWLWRPRDINNVGTTLEDLDRIRPEIIPVNSNFRAITRWVDIRSLIHTMSLAQNPGRLIRFFVVDRATSKLIGLIAMSSDVASLKVRDDYIGWTKEDKFENGRLNNTAIASTICATQPFGYNFLGGKLIAALTTSHSIRDEWRALYNDVLAGITTTSLYGGFSQYSGMKHFKSLGMSSGKILIKPDEEFYRIWVEYIKDTDPMQYEKDMVASDGQVKTGAKNNVISTVLKKLGLKMSDYEHGYQRGVYYASIYENSNEFLRNEIAEEDLVMKEKYCESIEGALNWWLPKAKKRYLKLVEQKRVDSSSLFYLPMIGMEWEEARDKYLGEVGR